MATKHPRINVTLDKETAKYLGLMAKKRKKTISATAKELIAQALEDSEDAYWLKIAEERRREGGKTISHAEFWKDIL
jgi:predicted DNA-binding protein